MEENNTNQPVVKNNGSIKNIKTYLSDMAEAVRQNQGSVIKIAMAEKNKREQEVVNQEVKVTNRSKVFLTVGGIVVIILAIGGAYFLFQKFQNSNVAQQTTQNVKSIISSDTNSFDSTQNVTNKIDLINLLDTERGTPGDAGSIKAIFLTKQIDGKPALLPLKDFVSLLGLTAPESLIRSLSDQYMVGTYTKNKEVVVDAETGKDTTNKSSLFFIFQTKDYNNAYAGMLGWENTMLDDMFAVFHIDVSGDNSSLFEKPFRDIVINNKDARVLYDKNSKALLYYIFIDKNTFVISDSQDSIKEIISRLLLQNIKPL